MNILAIDSAHSVLSTALYADDKFYIDEKKTATGHVEFIMGMIEGLVKKASIGADGIGGVLCMGGPGSFSGLRIGFATAKGLALSLGIPFAPVPSFDCIALPCSDNELVIPVIPARKNAYFFAVYRTGKIASPVYDEDIGVIDETLKTAVRKDRRAVLTGPGSELLYDALSKETREGVTLNFTEKGYSKELIEIAKNQKIFDNINRGWFSQGPDYFRKTDAETELLREKQ